ncbi:uncharacterized protein LOC127789812 [Diospyros lotus]|uniref:uncharacterized protein LOC127789812 n=1 Tax=Diospyros lotus TaxID=55363 RepID=UPI00224DDA01|nr:uncharacterized protein LOC127789812 [Diospyros lotus]XP_052174777.1 uncharacterized protein LOC127789812 [Diospyros lotus]
MGFGILDCLYLGILGNHNFTGRMVSNGDPGHFRSDKDRQNEHKASILTTLSTSPSRKGLLEKSNPHSGSREVKTTSPSKLAILNLGSAKLEATAEERDEISQSASGLLGCLKGFFSERIDWPCLLTTCKKWISNPLNMALVLWVTCVVASGAILFLLMTGMLNGVLPRKSQRNAWFEVNNQILNALFTLMCLYQHPKRFHHLILLCRWKPNDISQLTNVYCKNGIHKPHERPHMMVVIVLLHVNCFAQYALCGLNLGYKRSERPAIGVGVCLFVAIAAPAIAGLYSILSPLGREYDLGVDEEAQEQKVKYSERRFCFASGNDPKIVENRPVWRGGVLEFWEDANVACLSLFCSFCVFGWNMERLGLGNMYVHIATFLLFCTAPLWIFNLAAINIDNEAVREALGITGIVLCVFGLLYGGFWRIQMRKRFNLPASASCYGKPAIADCAQWLFCCCCSLAQEVRTADFYDILEEKFCRKVMDENESQLSTLRRENGLFHPTSGTNFQCCSSPRLYKLKTEDSQGKLSINKDMDTSMNPPAPWITQREDVTI